MCVNASNSAFILATSELGQTGLVLILKVDSSTTTGTSLVLVTSELGQTGLVLFSKVDSNKHTSFN